MVRRLRWLLIVLVMSTLTACSTGFVYNNIDWLIHWYIDDYVDLNKKQKEKFDDAFAEFMNWHRETELPRYQTHLADLKQKVSQSPLDAEQWQQEFDSLWQHAQRARDKLAPDIVELSRMLSDKQINGFFDELEKQNAKRESRYEEQDEAQRRESMIDDIEERVEDYTGRLTDEQRQFIIQYAETFTSNFEAWMSYRRLWQSQARQMLLARRYDNDFPADFALLLTEPEKLQSTQYQQVRMENRHHYASLIAQLHHSFTPEQKKRIEKELTDLIEMLSDLAPD